MHPKLGSNKYYGEKKTDYRDGGAWNAPKAHLMPTLQTTRLLFLA